MSLVKSDVTLLYINKTDLRPINILFFLLYTTQQFREHCNLLLIFFFFLSYTDHSLIIGRGTAQTERSQEPERNLDPSTDVNQSTLPLQPMSLALLQSTVPYMSLVMACPYITCCLKKKKKHWPAVKVTSRKSRVEKLSRNGCAVSNPNNLWGLLTGAAGRRPTNKQLLRAVHMQVTHRRIQVH